MIAACGQPLDGPKAQFVAVYLRHCVALSRSKSRESPCSMGILVCLETHRRVVTHFHDASQCSCQYKAIQIFLPKKPMDQMDQKDQYGQKHRFFVSQCRLGVM